MAAADVQWFPTGGSVGSVPIMIVRLWLAGCCGATINLGLHPDYRATGFAEHRAWGPQPVYGEGGIVRSADIIVERLRLRLLLLSGLCTAR